jgi:hypothetical protein
MTPGEMRKSMTNKVMNEAERSGQLTTAPITTPAANGADSPWMRLPKPKQRLWGMSRTTWNELLDGGKVKGITLRKKHAQRGIKLIHRPSAEAYLQRLMGGKEAQS